DPPGMPGGADPRTAHAPGESGSEFPGDRYPGAILRRCGRFRCARHSRADARARRPCTLHPEKRDETVEPRGRASALARREIEKRNSKNGSCYPVLRITRVRIPAAVCMPGRRMNGKPLRAHEARTPLTDFRISFFDFRLFSS